jgi:hypothetical protein
MYQNREGHARFRVDMLLATLLTFLPDARLARIETLFQAAHCDRWMGARLNCRSGCSRQGALTGYQLVACSLKLIIIFVADHDDDTVSSASMRNDRNWSCFQVFGRISTAKITALRP